MTASQRITNNPFHLRILGPLPSLHDSHSLTRGYSNCSCSRAFPVCITRVERTISRGDDAHKSRRLIKCTSVLGKPPRPFAFLLSHSLSLTLGGFIVQNEALRPLVFREQGSATKTTPLVKLGFYLIEPGINAAITCNVRRPINAEQTLESLVCSS